MTIEQPRYCTRCGSLNLTHIEGCAPVTVWGKTEAERQPVGNWRVYAWQCFDCHKIVNVVEILSGPGFPGQPDPGPHSKST